MKTVPPGATLLTPLSAGSTAVWSAALPSLSDPLLKPPTPLPRRSSPKQVPGFSPLARQSIYSVSKLVCGSLGYWLVSNPVDRSDKLLFRVTHSMPVPDYSLFLNSLNSPLPLMSSPCLLTCLSLPSPASLVSSLSLLSLPLPFIPLLRPPASLIYCSAALSCPAPVASSRLQGG